MKKLRGAKTRKKCCILADVLFCQLVFGQSERNIPEPADTAAVRSTGPFTKGTFCKIVSYQRKTNFKEGLCFQCFVIAEEFVFSNFGSTPVDTSIGMQFVANVIVILCLLVFVVLLFTYHHRRSKYHHHQ